MISKTFVMHSYLLQIHGHVTKKDRFEINIFNCDVGLLKSELINLQQNILLKDFLMVKIMQWNFGIHF